MFDDGFRHCGGKGWNRPNCLSKRAELGAPRVVFEQHFTHARRHLSPPKPSKLPHEYLSAHQPDWGSPECGQ
jgi:hypothetical protein